jgi:hypothetical protein
MQKPSKEDREDLGKDVGNHHFELPVYDKGDSHPTVAGFKLSKKRFLLAYNFHLLIRENYEPTDE